MLTDAHPPLCLLPTRDLVPELRRSAAEQLLALAASPTLLGVLANERQLEALWSLASPAW